MHNYPTKTGSHASLHGFRGTYLAGILALVVSVILTGCDVFVDAESSLDQPASKPPARADLQIPGLVELIDENLTQPVMPPNPGLVDVGAETYFQICLACHGDWGQGLTDEWRATWGEDQNCWQSKCHAANHPPWGFELPHAVPAVLGVGSMVRLRTASELHESIATTMPWWNPGSLTEEQAWGVTAYLLQKRGELADGIPLDRGTAPVIRLHAPAAKPVEYRPRVLLLAGVLTITLVAFTLTKRYPG